MKLVAAFSCLIFCVAARAAAPADVSGKWTTQTEVQGIAINETCILTQTADSKLTGTCDTSSGKFKLTGKVNGTSVNFSHPAAYQERTAPFHSSVSWMIRRPSAGRWTCSPSMQAARLP